jgi:Leucine-rich repeat (LRR) protein
MLRFSRDGSATREVCAALHASAPDAEPDAPVLCALRLSGSRLTGELDFSVFPRLEQLSMNDTGLTEVDLGKLTHLTELELAGNWLTSPPRFDGLTQLLSVDLSRNPSSMPPDLRPLRRLQRFAQHDSLLAAMPDVRGLDQLIQLELGGNLLTDLPPWIGELPATLQIDLRGNPLLSRQATEHLQRLWTSGLGPQVLFDDMPLSSGMQDMQDSVLAA